MQKLVVIILIGLLGICSISNIKAEEVSNKNIRDAILTLVHSYNVMDSKLERHEHRERALGELVKRALQSLQKGQKVYEPVKGIFSRLDERVSQIETMLIAQEEKYNAQSDKLTEAIETMFKWMTANAACNNEKSDSPPPSGKDDDEQRKLIEKVDKLSENVGKLAESSKGLLEQTEKLMDSKLSSTDEVISKMEDKLSHFYITGPASTAAPATFDRNPEFEKAVSYSLDKIYDRIEELQVAVKVPAELSKGDKQFLEGLSNQTRKSIGELKEEISVGSDKALSKTGDSLKALSDDLHMNSKEILQVLDASKTAATDFYSDVNKSVSVLQSELDVFTKFDKVLLATSDYVLDTQRKVEYGTHQVLMKVSEMIKLQSSDLNTTLQKRFDDIDHSIINNHLEALQNLSSTMESEISHVWRQIEIMHSEISYSKNALEKLQGQTEAYVNGTFTTMDSMGGKVSQITGRMSEVDENLNYLLGRLSLVTQEFNQIKTGLGSALDQIRSSFQTVQDKIKNVGPGPHVIPGDAEA